MNTLQVITVNYCVCVVCGLIYQPNYFTQLRSLPTDWLAIPFLLGTMFIGLFFLIANASQKIGVSYATMITKISLVIPTLVSHFLFHDSLDLVQWIGIGLAIISVILIHLQYLTEKSEMQVSLQMFIIIGILLFFGTGIADTLFKVFSHYHANMIPDSLVTITLFGIAGIWGVLIQSVLILTGKTHIHWRNIWGGVVVGIPNFFSVIALLGGLQVMPATQFFPVNHIGLLIVATVVGTIIYKEPFRWSGKVGLFLAILSIAMILGAVNELFAAFK